MTPAQREHWSRIQAEVPEGPISAGSDVTHQQAMRNMTPAETRKLQMRGQDVPLATQTPGGRQFATSQAHVKKVVGDLPFVGSNADIYAEALPKGTPSLSDMRRVNMIQRGAPVQGAMHYTVSHKTGMGNPTSRSWVTEGLRGASESPNQGDIYGRMATGYQRQSIMDQRLKARGMTVEMTPELREVFPKPAPQPSGGTPSLSAQVIQPSPPATARPMPTVTGLEATVSGASPVAGVRSPVSETAGTYPGHRPVSLTKPPPGKGPNLPPLRSMPPESPVDLNRAAPAPARPAPTGKPPPGRFTGAVESGAARAAPPLQPFQPPKAVGRLVKPTAAVAKPTGGILARAGSWMQRATSGIGGKLLKAAA